MVDGRRYVWWVAEDDDAPFIFGDFALHAASEDRRVLIRYHLNQPEHGRHVTVLGPAFRGLLGLGGPWRRFRCPLFVPRGEPVTPAVVATFIRWCTEDGPAVEVDYQGRPIDP